MTNNRPLELSGSVVVGATIGALAGGIPGFIIGGVIGSIIQEVIKCPRCGNIMKWMGKFWQCEKCGHIKT